ncbi:hypothetical protein G3496_02700 [Shewanella baltica]|uniref:hypothetical protein n=1 Tax=Shewanella baltica TaxID=62322 RepID=UPI00217DA036|nr:hypothetical protein [Shewanella baltica]MCS6133848.1 hypothetical protein [Shewanella baltica]
MLNDIIRKPDGSRISFYVNPDNTYGLVFTRRDVDGRHNIHRYGSDKYSTYEEAKLQAMKL